MIERAELYTALLKDQAGLHRILDIQMCNLVNAELDEITAMGFIGQRIYVYEYYLIVKFYNSLNDNLYASVYIEHTRVRTEFERGCLVWKMKYFMRDWGRILKAAVRYRKEYRAVIFALLPQPIAEEITAEFLLE